MPAAASADLCDGLKALYPLDSGTADFLEQQPAIDAAAGVSSTDRKVGAGALSGPFTLPSVHTMELSNGAFSIAFWIRKQSSTAPPATPDVVRYGAGLTSWGIVEDASDRWIWDFPGAGGRTAFDDSHLLAANPWFLAVLVVEADGAFRTYGGHDGSCGVLTREGAPSQFPFQAQVAQALAFGSDVQLDEVAIWDRALSKPEADQLLGCGDGISLASLCVDPDQCAEGSAVYDVMATCVDTATGYDCACPTGYAGDGKCSVTWNLSTCSATGRIGPDQAACDAAYAGTSLQGYVTVTSGYQRFVIPSTGTCRITARGAAGGTVGNVIGSMAIGGKGAEVAGDFALTQGDELIVVVGQAGQSKGCSDGGGGGGGSTVVARIDPENGSTISLLGIKVTPLIVAGAGGGSGDDASGCNYSPGPPKARGFVSPSGAGGGGYTLVNAGGGAGFIGNGKSGWSAKPLSFLNGALGGGTSGRFGGFGGGGTPYNKGGGGAGYTGGNQVNSLGAYGNGGSSYNVGTDISGSVGTNSGDGSMHIQPAYVGCTDIDECATGTAGCDPQAACANSVGSFTCTCPAELVGDGFQCDVDTDGDGLGDAWDPCPGDANNDSDGDGVCGCTIGGGCPGSDNCPELSNADQADCDEDGLGNVRRQRLPPQGLLHQHARWIRVRLQRRLQRRRRLLCGHRRVRFARLERLRL